VLLFARVGALHGNKTPLYLVTNDAGGVLQGTEVWLGGRRVGIVNDVRFQPASSDTSERILIAMDVLTPYFDQIRRNSNVKIRPGGNLIGAPVVSIIVGTSNSPQVAAGDTLRALAEQFNGREQSTATVTSLGDSVVAVAATIRTLRKEVHETGTDVDALRARSEKQITAVGRALDRFTHRATQSRGTVALAIHDTTLHFTVARLSAQTDSLRTLLASNRGSLGRFRRDSTLFITVAHVQNTVTTLRARIANGNPLARADSTLPHQLDQLHLQLDSLIANAKEHPFRYLPL
jgi:hypothetical protein